MLGRTPQINVLQYKHSCFTIICIIVLLGYNHVQIIFWTKGQDSGFGDNCSYFRSVSIFLEDIWTPFCQFLSFSHLRHHICVHSTSTCIHSSPLHWHCVRQPPSGRSHHTSACLMSAGWSNQPVPHPHQHWSKQVLTLFNKLCFHLVTYAKGGL